MECEGDYVCHKCHLIYSAYGSELRCDLCGKKLRWASVGRIEELKIIWDRSEHRKGLHSDFAYYRGQEART
jgi:PHP family Zn ribbon phosphoesterase